MGVYRGRLAPQSLVGFFSSGPKIKKLLRKKKSDQKKGSLNKKYKGQSEDESLFQARISSEMLT
jgi:hypothetical protein